MKKASALLFSALLLVACTGNSGKPSDTYKEFTSHLEKGELEAAYNLVDKQSRESVNKQQWVANLNASAELIKKHRGVKEIKVIDEEQKEDIATSTVVVTFNDGFSGKTVHRFKNEQNTWKLVVK